MSGLRCPKRRNSIKSAFVTNGRLMNRYSCGSDAPAVSQNASACRRGMNGTSRTRSFSSTGGTGNTKLMSQGSGP
jgi:hypothetical protein